MNWGGGGKREREGTRNRWDLGGQRERATVRKSEREVGGGGEEEEGG